MPERHVITAPAGAGKTTHVINRIIDLKRQDPLSIVWVLLPTSLQIGTFRDRLLDDFGNVYFGVQFFTFYDLYTHLLNLMHVPQKRIDQSSVFRVMRHIINGIMGDLHYFTPIADKSGFIDVVVRFIFELKQAHAAPFAFEDFAQTYRDSPKHRDIALIYRKYQEFLQDNKLVDREGAGWLALAELNKRENPVGNVSLLVVDGFTQFSPLQAKLLNAVTDFVPETILTLTHEPKRATTIHRTYNQTLSRICQYHTDWQVEPLHSDNTWQAAPLMYLEEHFMSATVPPIEADGALRCIEAPNTEAEVRMVLREIKRMLLSGEHPEDILILARDMLPYIDMLRSAAVRYNLPIIFREGISLSQNPAVAALLDLLNVHNVGVNFRRQAVMDVLRTPYFQTNLSTEDINALERISLRYKVVNNRKKWRDAVELAIIEQEREAETLLLADALDEGELTATPPIDERLIGRLDDYFDRITPPKNATPREYVQGLESLLGSDPAYTHEYDDDQPDYGDSLHFYEQVRRDAVDETGQSVVTRDLYALRELRKCLLDLLAAHELVDEQVITWPEFMTDFERALRYYESETVGPQYRSGHVLATTVFDARGLPHKHVFIMGLSEGRFPTQRSEDPLYSDREREAMIEHGINVATTDQQEDDTSIFYTCAAMAQQTLTLSRPTIDEKANPWSPSVLWQSTVALLKNPIPNRLTAGTPPSIDDAADEREFIVSLAYSLEQPENAEALAGYLHGPLWNNILTARDVDVRRRQVFDEYSGAIQDEMLREIVADTLAEHRQWSASQFNDYGYCPFRFYAKRLLKLDEFTEPEEGLDPMQLGSLQHEILEFTYGYFKSNQIPISPENLETALEALTAKAQSTFADAPRRWEFRESGVWEKEKEEILLRLTEFVRRDFAAHEKSPFHPRNLDKLSIASNDDRYIHEVELPFGVMDAPAAILSGGAGDVLVNGLIDRIDRIGNQLVIIDYKSGTNLPNLKELEKARNFQMLVYLLAAQQLLEGDGLTVVGGIFWSLRRPDKSEIIPVDRHILDSRLMDLHNNILNARAGIFHVKANGMEDGKCYKYCEFYQLCRESRDIYVKEG